MKLCIDGNSHHYVPDGQSCNGLAADENPLAPISASTILPIFAGWSPVTEFPDALDPGQGLPISAVIAILAAGALVFLALK